MERDLEVLTAPSEARLRLLYELAVERLAEGRYTDCFDLLERIEGEFEAARVPPDSPTAADALLWAPCLLAQCYMAQGLYGPAWEALEVAEARFGARAAAGAVVRPKALESRFVARYQLLAALDRPAQALALCEEFYRDTRIAPSVIEQFQANRAWMLDDLQRTGEALPAGSPAVEVALQEVLERPGARHREVFHTCLRLAQRRADAGDTDGARAQIERARATATGPIERARVEGLAAQVAAATGVGLDEAWATWSVAFDDFIALWANTPPPESGLGFLNYDDRQGVLTGGIALALARGASAEDAFAILLRGHAASRLSQALGAEPTSVDGVRRALLGPSTLLLTYITSSRLGFVFALGAEGPLEVHRLGPRAEALPVARRLQDLLDRDPVPLAPGPRAARARDLVDLGRDLGAVLVPAPLAPAVAAARTLLVAGGDFLPPCALEVVQVDGAQLGLTHAIGFLPSLPAAVALAGRERTPRALGALVVGDVPEARGSDRPRLRLQANDVRGLVEGWAGARCQALVGERATRSGLSAVWADTGFALLLLHGDEDRRRMEVGFVLAGDRPSDPPTVVFPSELARWPRAPQVVVANYCGSGRGALRMGEGGGGLLVETLLVSGAHAVAVSPSDLEFRASVALWTEALGHLAPEVSPAEALRRARVTLAGRSDELGDPFAYARVMFHGLAHVPIPSAPATAARGEAAPERARRPLGWAAAALVLLGLGALLRRRARRA